MTKTPPEWEDLPNKTKIAIIEQANSRLWWQGLGERISGLRGPLTLLLAFAAAGVLLRDGARDLILWLVGGTNP